MEGLGTKGIRTVHHSTIQYMLYIKLLFANITEHKWIIKLENKQMYIVLALNEYKNHLHCTIEKQARMLIYFSVGMNTI